MHNKRCVDFPGHVIELALIVLFSSLAVLGADNQAAAEQGTSFDFKEVDTDGSGCVEGPEEMEKFRSKVENLLQKALPLRSLENTLRASRITHMADVSGDGRICECDLLSILLTETTSAGLHYHPFRVYEDGSIFDDIDDNNDGFLDDDTEKKALVEKMSKCVGTEKAHLIVDAMSKIDIDDRRISKKEYLQFSHSKEPAYSLTAQKQTRHNRPIITSDQHVKSFPNPNHSKTPTHYKEIEQGHIPFQQTKFPLFKDLNPVLNPHQQPELLQAESFNRLAQDPRATSQTAIKSNSLLKPGKTVSPVMPDDQVHSGQHLNSK